MLCLIGLFKGVGRGVVGIVAQPATGVIDFASGSLHAFNNVIDPKQVAKPIRPPRYIASNHAITAYSLPAALGKHLSMCPILACFIFSLVFFVCRQ